MTEVVSMFGGEVPATGEPRQSVIELLEMLLERANAGNLQAVGVVTTDIDGCAAWHASGLLGGYSMIGALAILNAFLMDAAVE